MDPDVVEIPPPLYQKPSRFQKQKQQVLESIQGFDFY
jgi:hypothetical protein